MVDSNALFGRNTSQDVNATVDGDEDRGATPKDLAHELEDTGGPVDPNSGSLDESSPAANEDPSPEAEAHDYEGSTKGARTHTSYEGQEDNPGT